MIRRKKTKRGRGVLDFFKPIMSFAVENKDVIEKVAKDVVSISQNTRDLIKEIKSKKKPEVLDRINRLRAVGSGFAYI